MSSTRRRIIILFIALIIVGTAFVIWQALGYLSDPRGRAFVDWWRAGEEQRAAMITVQREPCPGAPFVLPTDGFIGLVYGDPRGPYSGANPHQGLDIFSPDRDQPGLVPVYAASDGYITREAGWRSALIQRIPEDPLDPSRQIWLYYAHMADREGNDFIEEPFQPGASEVFVEQGTLLGYTGNFNGNSPRGIWVHLHFSIVQDNGSGAYLNELEFENTVDPSQYLGMPLNFECGQTIPACAPVIDCSQ